MKKRIIPAVMLCAAMLISGCAPAGEPKPTPAPETTVTPVTPPAENNGDVSGSNGADSSGSVPEGSPGTPEGTVGEKIENFVEGMTVELATLPEDIRNAIKKEYPEATVKTVAYTTYENRQMYKVTAQNGDDSTEEFYISPSGEIIPVKDAAAQQNSGSASN